MIIENLLSLAIIALFGLYAMMALPLANCKHCNGTGLRGNGCCAHCHGSGKVSIIK